MAVIRPYDREFYAKDAYSGGRRATPEDMGVAEGIHAMAVTAQNTMEYFKQKQENDELADAQVTMAKSNSVWADRMDTLQKDAKPGAYTAFQVRDEMRGYFNQTKGNYKTEAARKYVELHGIQKTDYAYQQALKFDVQLEVKDTFNKQDQFINELSKTAIAQPHLYDQMRKQIQSDMESNVGVWRPIGDAMTQMGMEDRKKALVYGFDKAFAWSQKDNPTTIEYFKEIGKPPKPPETAKQQPAFSANFEALKSAGVDDKNIARLMRTKTTPDQDSALVAAAAGDAQKEAFLRTVLTIENRGNETISNNAKSPAGALGAFQFIASTGKQYGLMTDDDRMDFGKSSAAAGKYYDDLNKRYGGNIMAMIAEYNGGTKAAEAVMAGKEPAAKETQDYLRMAKGLLTSKQEAPLQQAAAEEFSVEAAQKEAPQWFKNLNPHDQEQFMRHINVASKRNDAVADKALNASIQDQESSFVLTGKVPQALPRSAFRDEAQWQAYSGWHSIATKTEAIMGASPQDQMTFLNSMKPVADPALKPGVYASQAKDYAQATKMIEDSNKRRAADPIGYAMGSGFVAVDKQIEPINDFSKSDELAAQLLVRIPQSEAVNETYGTGKNFYLRKEEASALKATIDRMNPKEANAYVADLTHRLGSPNRAMALFAQVSPNDKALVKVAEISTAVGVNPGKQELDTSAIMLGRGIINQLRVTEKEGTKDEKNYGSTALPSADDVRKLIIAKHPSLAVHPQAMESIVESTMAHYIGSSSRNQKQDFSLTGKEPFVEANKKAFNESMKALLNTSTFGASTVPTPYGMEESKFRDLVQEKVDVAFGGKRKMGSYSLEPVGGLNKYRVVVGGMQTGNEVIIDATESTYSHEGRGVAYKAPEKDRVLAKQFADASAAKIAREDASAKKMAAWYRGETK